MGQPHIWVDRALNGQLKGDTGLIFQWGTAAYIIGTIKVGLGILEKMSKYYENWEMYLKDWDLCDNSLNEQALYMRYINFSKVQFKIIPQYL